MSIARVTIGQTWFGQVVQNVIHLDFGESPYNPLAIKGAIETLWIPAIRPMQLSSLRYVLIEVRNMGDIHGTTSDFAINIVGSAGSAVEGWGPLCYLWSLQTAFGGHKGRGRIYLAGCYPGNVVQGRFISASMDQQITAVGQIMTRFTGAAPTSGFNLVVATRETLPFNNPVTNIVPRDVPGVQRRRNIGVGV